MKSIGILLLIILQSNLFYAQSSNEIEAVYSVTSEKLTSNDAKDVFESKLFHSFGLNGKVIFKSNLFVTGGLHFKQFGTKFEVEETTVEMPEGTGEFYEVDWNVNSINTPVKLGYYFLNKDKLRLGLAVGLSNSFVLNQKQVAKGIESDIEVYQDYIFNFVSNLEIGIDVSKTLTLNIIPVWERQVNSNFGEYKQSGFGCQLGISYNFEKE